MAIQKIPFDREHLLQLVELLFQLEEIYADMAESIKENDSYPENLTWVELYEKPFTELVNDGSFLFQRLITPAISGDNPNQGILDIAKWQPQKQEVDKLSESPSTIDLQNMANKLVALSIVFARSMDSLSIHGVTMYHLIKMAKEGSDKSLFDAIRIDRAVIALPAFSARIHKAVILNDAKFLTSLSNMLSPKTENVGDKNPDYNPLRFIIACLQDTGQPDIATNDLMDLFPNITAGHLNNPENFRRYINSYKKFPTKI